MRTLFIVAVLSSFAPALSQTWVARYNGPANSEDLVSGIAIDDSGYVYVTGTSWATGNGNDIVIIKYSPEGESIWTVRYDGATHSNDEARAIVVKDDRVIVVGGSTDADLFTNIVTTVYNTKGESLWTAIYDSPAGGNDFGLVVTVDDSGYVYVAGYASGDTTGWDLIVLKYDSNGTLVWTSKFVTLDEDYAVGIAIVPNGAVFVAGNSGHPYFLTWDYVTIRLNANTGDTVWTRRYNGPAQEQDEARAMILTPDGYLYLTGGSTGTNSGIDITTLKYSLSGDLLWERRYNGPANSIDWANGIACDANGNVYVTGYSQGITSDCDYVMVKYDGAGTELLVRRYDGPASGYDEAKAIAVDDEGNVYVTGSSNSSGTRNDYATVKYDVNGNEEWVYRYNGPASRRDEAIAIALDNTRVYITGNSEGNGTGTDFATLRYEAVGLEELSSLTSLHSSNRSTIFAKKVLFTTEGNKFLLNASGEQVMRLNAGTNDISGLPGGIYFIQNKSPGNSRTNLKTVIAH
ncbi:MAG: SBBP repeat-containing protein [candidate division WOR-3 bacterium]